MMGLPDTPSDAPHLYPQALQLKLYQAFIFSIPILFSIILFLLFYLFYLKRRDSVLSSPPILPTISTQATAYVHSVTRQTCAHMGWKGEIKDRLPTIWFDEELRTRDSQCCVCLGEFEIKEELLQVPSCKHVFHMECIHHWLYSNTTCPLCRCPIIPVSKPYNPTPQSVTRPPLQDGGTGSNQNQQNTSSASASDSDFELEPQQLDVDGGSSSVSNSRKERQLTVHIEGTFSASKNTCPSSSERLPNMPPSCSDQNESCSDQDSVIAHIHSPNQTIYTFEAPCITYLESFSDGG